MFLQLIRNNDKLKTKGQKPVKKKIENQKLIKKLNRNYAFLPQLKKKNGNIT